MVKKKAAKTAPGVGDEVEISSLNTLQFFTYQGGIYSKRKVTPAGVKALSQDGSELITLPPDTLVTVIEPKLEASPEPGEAETSTEPEEGDAAGPTEGEAKASPEE